MKNMLAVIALLQNNSDNQYTLWIVLALQHISMVFVQKEVVYSQTGILSHFQPWICTNLNSASHQENRKILISFY